MTDTPNVRRSREARIRARTTAGRGPPVLVGAEVASFLVAYADGSGTIATQPAGAGVVVYRGGHPSDVHPGEESCLAEASWFLGHGTSNHAELSAARVALWLTELPPFAGLPLILRTDSMYAIQALTRPDDPGAHHANAAVIVATRRLLVGRVVIFEHVRGHTGVTGNERADRLASQARLRGVRAAEARARAALR